ncbi:MAG: hydrogenase expression/formation protein HypE [bacterium]
MDTVTLSMGSGGAHSSKLLTEVFLPFFGNEILNTLDDSAAITVNAKHLAFTTDSYTIQPIFFPGGDIGKLSICGTVNDLAAKGARALVVSTAFIIEEGFSIEQLRRIARSMRETTDAIGITIVTGDTKVVRKGEADGIFITTSGIGAIIDGMDISSTRARPGDDIIISGTIADHGMAVLNAREGLGFTPEIRSDVASLCDIVAGISARGGSLHVMRDPTRGGVASALNEIARASHVAMTLFEDRLPLRQEVRSCCALLGMDPLYIANEGKLIIIADPGSTADILSAIKAIPLGKDAAVIGKVDKTPYTEGIPPVSLQTAIGTKRFVPLLDGDPLPRIC